MSNSNCLKLAAVSGTSIPGVHKKETLANQKKLPYQNLFNTVIGIHLMIFKIYICVKSVSIHSL